MRLSATTALAPAMLLLGGCEPGVLHPAGKVAGVERMMLFDSLAVMFAIVVPLVIAVPIIAWWFRADNPRAIRRPDWTFSGQLELLVWSIPALVVIFVGGIAWAGSHDADPARPLAPAPLRVDVVSLDWKWLFLYPDQGIATVNRLVVPAGRAVSFRLTSASVMNSFWVPRLGSQIYMMPGMVTKLHLEADRSGRYRGLSANYSGSGFADMAFAVDAVPAGDFQRWMADAQRGAAFDRGTYRRLIAIGTAPAATYRIGAPDLFDAIVQASAPPARNASTNMQGH